jgi:hypothetical protein
MSRNAERLNQPNITTTEIPEQQATYSPPTTLVELPSQGKFYDPSHPLHDKDTVEIKPMTTRQEEILTNQSIIQAGEVVDRLVKSVLMNQKIDPTTLLIGDKNAILIALRVDGYGEDYEVNINCPVCTLGKKENIDLSQLGVKGVNEEIEMTDRGTFLVELPRTKAKVELRLLTGGDEKYIAEANKKQKKYGIERPLANQYSRMIVSVNGDEDPSVVSSFASSMPAFDSRFLRKIYKTVNPDVDMSFHFQCGHCGHEQGMEVPITANFFWVD